MARRSKPIEIPRAFQLANARWRVLLVTQETLRRTQIRNKDFPVIKLDGYCLPGSCRIMLNKALSRERLEESWLHELEHAIEEARGCPDSGPEHVVGPRAKLRAQVYHSSKGVH